WAYIVHDCEGAIGMADQAVTLNPNAFLAWLARGHVYRFAGLQEEALRSYERSMCMSPVDPRDFSVFVGMGFALIELGRFDEATVAAKKAVRVSPCYAPAYRCLASTFAHLGREAEAHEAAARVLELDPAFTVSALIARGGQVKLLIEGL